MRVVPITIMFAPKRDSPAFYQILPAIFPVVPDILMDPSMGTYKNKKINLLNFVEVNIKST
jgi:hypothetical protein